MECLLKTIYYFTVLRVMSICICYIARNHQSQGYASTTTEKFPAVSILPLPVFLYFSPIFPSHFYILPNLVYSLYHLYLNHFGVHSEIVVTNLKLL